jgi:hypothetical protein
MKEWHRTVLLSVLLIVAIGISSDLRTGYDSQALDVLR